MIISATMQIQYLYMRSFFPEYGVPGNMFKAYNYYRKQSQQIWLKQSQVHAGHDRIVPVPHR